MDINNLITFLEVAEKQSFSKSAESLNLTQPAVSKRIATLESDLSTQLFDRVSRKVRLTEAGEILLSSALKISSEISRLEVEMSNIGKAVRGKLRIGSAKYVNLDLLGQVISNYRKLYPDVEIDLHFLCTAKILEGIENQTLDIGLCSIDNAAAIRKKRSKLSSYEVWTEELKVAVGNNHPLAGVQNVTVEQLAIYPAILPGDISSVRQLIDKAMIACHREAIVSMEPDDFRQIKTMVEIGVGWACLPESQIDDSLQILAIDDLDLPHSVALVNNSGLSLTRAAQAFFDTIVSKSMAVQATCDQNIRDVQCTKHSHVVL